MAATPVEAPPILSPQGKTVTAFQLTMKPSFMSDTVSVPLDVTRRLKTVLERLCEEPLLSAGNIKKLKGYRNLYRYRLEHHRLIYAVDPDTRVIQLLALGPRRDIYQRFDDQPALPDRPLADVQPEHELDDSHLEVLEIPREEAPPGPPSSALPTFSAEDLAKWQVPEEFHETLLECRTEDGLLSAPVPDQWKLRVLDVLFPRPVHEVETQPDLVVQKPEDLEAYAEGRLTEFLLHLDPEQEALVDRNLQGPAMVKGGPGSGKSTVALYRVKAVLNSGYAGSPTARVLFTTYTRALTSLSEQLLDQLLEGNRSRVEVRTTDNLAMSILSERGGHMPKVADSGERRRALEKVREQSASDSDDLEAYLESASLESLPVDYLLDEFHWVIEGIGLQTWEEYEVVPRVGRGIRLDRALRRRVWELYQGWRKELNRRKLASWGDVRAEATKLVESGRVPRQYEYVLVDEAQDLTPQALRLCIAVCSDPRGLFLAADAGQSLYNQGFSWQKVHDDLRFRGRTRLLKRNYRSTRALGRAAADVLNGHPAGDTETLAQEFVREGPLPEIGAFRSRGEQYRWLAQCIRDAARELRLSPAAAAVLCPTHAIVHAAATALAREGLETEVVEGRSYRLDSPRVKVMTMHSAKGLEFPIVALPLLEKDVLPSVLPEGDDPLVHDQAQRRLFHVAVSRAMRRLFVSTSVDHPSPYLQTLTPSLWNWSRE